LPPALVPDVSSPPHAEMQAAQPTTIAMKVNRTLFRMRCMKASVIDPSKQDKPQLADEQGEKVRRCEQTLRIADYRNRVIP
jgi:hypothetical protein